MTVMAFTYLKDLITICRPQQWYKNLVIFMAIFFLEDILVVDKLWKVILGFVSLCLISSANYIINDIADRERDAQNPEKRNTPLAAKRVSTINVLFFAAIILGAGLYIAETLAFYFLLCALSLFVTTLIYTFLLKKELFMDIIGIATNFVLRAISGAVILNVVVSPWLVIGTFFLSLFLSTGKRISEHQQGLLSYRPVLKQYTPEVTKPLVTASAAILIVCFSLYTFLSKHPQIIITLPLNVYLVFRYLYLVESGSSIARKPERIYKDVRFFGVLILTAILTTILIYWF